MPGKHYALYIYTFLLFCACNVKPQKINNCLNLRISKVNYDVNAKSLYSNLGWNIHPGVDTLGFKRKIFNCSLVNNSNDTISIRIMNGVLFYYKAIGYKNGLSEDRDWDGWPMGYAVYIEPKQEFNCGFYSPFSQMVDSVFIEVHFDAIINGFESPREIQFTFYNNDFDSIGSLEGICEK